jgi:hypothetical protein
MSLATPEEQKYASVRGDAETSLEKAAIDLQDAHDEKRRARTPAAFDAAKAKEQSVIRDMADAKAKNALADRMKARLDTQEADAKEAGRKQADAAAKAPTLAERTAHLQEMQASGYEPLTKVDPRQMTPEIVDSLYNTFQKTAPARETTARTTARDERKHAWDVASRVEREKFIKDNIETREIGADRRKQMEIDASARIASAKMGATDAKAQDAKAKSVVDELGKEEDKARIEWDLLKKKAAAGQVGADDPDLVGGKDESGAVVPSAWDRYQEAKAAHEGAMRAWAHPEVGGEDKKAAVLRSFSLLPKEQQTDEAMSKMLKDAGLMK